MELLRTWRRNGFVAKLYWTGDARNLSWYFRDTQANVTFRGDRFGVGASTGVDSLEAVYGLLSFMSTAPGDTDADYFKDYTPAQLAWAESRRCEELAGMVYNWQERRDKR